MGPSCACAGPEWSPTALRSLNAGMEGSSVRRRLEAELSAGLSAPLEGGLEEPQITAVLPDKVPDFHADGDDTVELQKRNVLALLEFLKVDSEELVVNVGSGVRPLTFDPPRKNPINLDRMDFAERAARKAGADYVSADLLKVVESVNPAHPEQLPGVLLFYRMGPFVEIHQGRNVSEFWQAAWRLIRPGGWILLVNPPEPEFPLPGLDRSYQQILSALGSSERPFEVRAVTPDGTLASALALALRKPAGGLEEASRKAEDSARPRRLVFDVRPGERHAVELTLRSKNGREILPVRVRVRKGRVEIAAPSEEDRLFVTHRERSLQPGAVFQYTLYKTRRALGKIRAGEAERWRPVKEKVYFFPVEIIDQLLAEETDLTRSPARWRAAAPYVFSDLGPNAQRIHRVELRYREISPPSSRQEEEDDPARRRTERAERFVRERAGRIPAKGLLWLDAEQARRLSGNGDSTGGVVIRLPSAPPPRLPAELVFAQPQISEAVPRSTRDSAGWILLQEDPIADKTGIRTVARSFYYAYAAFREARPDWRELVLVESHPELPLEWTLWREVFFAQENLPGSIHPRVVALTVEQAAALSPHLLAYLGRQGEGLPDILEFTLVEQVRDEQDNRYAVVTWA